jgi:hypothetical protein
MEIWLDAVGFSGWYEVSNLGNVRSVSRVVKRKRGFAFWKGRRLRKRIHSGGYYNANMSVDGVSHYRFIHRMVAEAFIPNPENLPFVNHIDGNKKNNNVENLEWCTEQENNIHALETGLRKIKLYKVVDLSGNVVYDSISLRELVGKGFQQPAISRCLSGKLKSHRKCTFEILGEVNEEV